MLKAAVHKTRGELLQETAELKTAIRIADSALVRTSLARALRTSGQPELADQLIADMRAQMRSLDLRRPLRHPLLSPGRALAWRETTR